MKFKLYSLKIYYLPLILLLLVNCQHPSPPSVPTKWQFIAGRDDGYTQKRPLLYRALVPLTWIRQDPLLNESIVDTTQSICEFYIRENDQTIRITVHTFPIIQSSLRISPQAQINRWKKQFEELDSLMSYTSSESHGGFSGLYFEGQGLLKGTLTKVIGWSMQLASHYERQLSLEKHPFDREKRADYTIKVSGPPHLIDQHRSDLFAFARSFELIDELPSP